MPKQKQKINYKWVIFALCFLMVFICLGFCSSNKGLYLAAITKALGIQRSLFSINDSCRFIASAIINLFFGTLVSRFGVRKMTAFGFITLIMSMLLYAYADNIFLFYIGGILLGVGLAFTTTTMASSIIHRWFQHDVGKYTGIVFAANGVGGALAAQIISPMINEEGNPYGYRNSYLFVTVLLLIVGVIVVALLREKPEGQEITHVKTVKKKVRGCEWNGIDFGIVKKRPYFYLTGIIVLLTGFALQGISGAYAAHMTDVGLDSGFIATVISMYALMLTVSKIVVGALFDKFGLRVVMIICQCAAVIAFLSMAFIDASTSGMVLAVVFGIFYALALPLETLVIPLIVNDMFGIQSYDKILGIMCAMNYVGYALGSPIVNLCYDTFGTYKPILLVFSIIMIPLAILFQFGISASRKERGQ